MIKIKIGLTCGYREYEAKIKMVKVQWLQPKIKFWLRYNNFLAVRGHSSHPHQKGRPQRPHQHVWSFINLKIARKSHPHHSMTSAFSLSGAGSEIVYKGQITDPLVIWLMHNKVEKGPSQLFIPNHFVPLFRQ